MTNSKILGEVLIKISQSQNNEEKIEGFFNYLKSKNFMGLLPQIKNYINKQQEKVLQDKILVITTKHGVSSGEVKEIVSLVGAPEDVKVEIIKDDEVIGGFLATYQGNIYDGSLRNRITQLKAKLNS